MVHNCRTKLHCTPGSSSSNLGSKVKGEKTFGTPLMLTGVLVHGAPFRCRLIKLPFSLVESYMWERSTGIPV